MILMPGLINSLLGHMYLSYIYQKDDSFNSIFKILLTKMKIGFSLPGKFHFKPILIYLIKKNYLRLLIISHLGYVKNWLNFDNLNGIKLFNTFIILSLYTEYLIN